jgi:hypothetical protein
LAVAAAVSSDILVAAEAPIPAEIIKIMTTDAVVEPDGSYTTVSHFETSATNDSAARNIAQHQVDYSESMETVEILEAFTRKVDGRVLQVDPTQIFAQAPPGSPRVPMFSDRKQKVIVFPDVAANDTLVYTIKYIRKPPFPGQFFFGGVFVRGFAFEDVRINITLPIAMAAHVEAARVDHEVAETAQSLIHRFVYRNPRPPPAEPAALSSWDTEPHYIISTFPDYGAISTAYPELSAGKAAVTPRLQALAEEITADATDRHDQARRLYDWVSKHIRYVAVILGNGGYVPHDAATVLENGYGDCKDHVVLLEALLAAKGIASLPALIDSANRYRAPEVAIPAAFNHVLSYLPEFDIYADPTIGVAPFGTLAAAEYGKSVAVAAETDPGLRVLQRAAAEENEETLRTTAELKPDGSVSGQSTTTASGPFGITLRQEAARMEAGGREKMAATQLRTLGGPGKGSFEFDPPRDQLGPTYTVSGSFELEARPEFVDGKPFTLPSGLRLIVRPGEFLLGSWNVKRSEPTPCSSGHQVEELSLTLPPGRDITSLPGGKTVENRYLSYHSDWSQVGQVVTVRREMLVRVPVAVCRDDLRATLADAIAQIRADYRSELALKPLLQ